MSSNEDSKIQTHHISYNPEITIDILKELHEEFHGHPVESFKGMKRRKFPLKKPITNSNGCVRYLGKANLSLTKVFRDNVGLIHPGTVAPCFLAPNMILITRDGLSVTQIQDGIDLLKRKIEHRLKPRGE